MVFSLLAPWLYMAIGKLTLPCSSEDSMETSELRPDTELTALEVLSDNFSVYPRHAHCRWLAKPLMWMGNWAYLQSPRVGWAGQSSGDFLKVPTA